MADMAANEKTARAPEVDSQTPSMEQVHGDAAGSPPTGWMYKSRKIGGLTLPYYASPKAQLLLVSFVCFLCPGKHILAIRCFESLGNGAYAIQECSMRSMVSAAVVS